MSAPTPFHDLDDHIALPRVSGLAMSPDGRRLVTTVQTLSPDRTEHRSALWGIDPSGRSGPVRLTRSEKGESSPAFLADGTLVFTSSRPDPDSDDSSDDDDPRALWALPAGGGEASLVLKRPGSVASPVAARDADAVVVVVSILPSADGVDDATVRSERADAKVSAILHESFPVRYWDHDLGPAQPHLVLLTGVRRTDRAAPDGDRDGVEVVDLTPEPGRRFDETTVSISSDGATVLAVASRPDGGGLRAEIVAIDVASREQRVLLASDEAEFSSPVIDPTGRRAVVLRESDSSPDEPIDVRPLLVDLETGEVTELVADWDRWPGGFAWLPDGSAVLCVADDDGSAPVFRIDLADDGSSTVTRLTTDHGAYGDVRVAPDGTAFAVRSAVDSPPGVVRIDASKPGEPTPLDGPAPSVDLPGRLEAVEVRADDGARVRGWLAMPHDASAHEPAPLLLWIHGGPLASWNAWSWRWNPWLAVARGYAVLLPDPALSTGYGLDFVRRGWGRWGAEPFTDLMAITDAAESRDDVDATRTAAMGGSFGGYMANWVAGHTDRFDAIVTHASLWNLEQFGPTTDRPDYWRRELTDEMASRWSPHRHAEAMTTPVLVIHGDRDYRVPIGEALNLWSTLARHHAAADGTMDHKLLYFPDENHWILSPQHAVTWYRTVLAFLDHHVLGAPWRRPGRLG
ncbi:alpha/beta fold hydrolase [Ilumatobacter sp.]|uniref:S9 family peptidase n=1 Tax=Ilumatobacter sp. TaxID=1967498 RepID=UPI003B52A864